LKNETPYSTSILTSNKDPEGIQKGVYRAFACIVCSLNDLQVIPTGN